ncbi:hypothetical protein PPL_04819 [Heterostelium album PN500]|uniref:Uncharacterized protein n=1 Tax=Heterostelium pallidum (strain ATCC 26659 / Pp 5 / PN500) TaxID=670386 RepID=D3B8M6_HETP5|nr:hypothetical protein PPL_04819 [Heterostelium album PN500]EFA82394.1 hypothetical protein PPL_04819 [Heterostelium album PN500]|eukprot:XP_020434511.1 hypothetical protein PPL_04819 [Heterostelium album PN500]
MSQQHPPFTCWVEFSNKKDELTFENTANYNRLIHVIRGSKQLAVGDGSIDLFSDAAKTIQLDVETPVDRNLQRIYVATTQPQQGIPPTLSNISEHLQKTYGDPKSTDKFTYNFTQFIGRQNNINQIVYAVCMRFKTMKSNIKSDQSMVVIAGPPGIGKSRILQEVPRHLISAAELPKHQITVAISFSNGTPLESTEMSAGVAISTRMLYSYFIGGLGVSFKHFISQLETKFVLRDLTPSLALSIIVEHYRLTISPDIDIVNDKEQLANWQKQQQIMVLIALDEFQKALIESDDHHIRRSYLKNVILELLSLSKQDTTTTGISTPSALLEKGTFVYIMTAGTILEPIDHIISKDFGLPYTFISLPLLTREESRIILFDFLSKSSMGNTNSGRIPIPPSFLTTLDTTGGWPRPIELFLRTLVTNPADIDKPNTRHEINWTTMDAPVRKLFEATVTEFDRTYPKLTYKPYFDIILSHAITEHPILAQSPLDDAPSYMNLQSDGLLLLEGNTVRLPFIFIHVYAIRTNFKSLVQLTNFIIDMRHDEEWETFVALYDFVRGVCFGYIGVVPTIDQYYPNAYLSNRTLKGCRMKCINSGAHIFAPKRYPESCEEWEKNIIKDQLEEGYSLSNSKGALVDFVLRRKIWINNNWTWIWILGDAKFTSDDKILDFNSVVKPVLKKCEEAHKNLVPKSSEGPNQPSSDVPFGYIVFIPTNKRLSDSITAIKDYDNVIIVSKEYFNYFSKPFSYFTKYDNLSIYDVHRHHKDQFVN